MFFFENPPTVQKKRESIPKVEASTETVNILEIIKISQSSEQVIIDVSEWRKLESKRIRVFTKELAMSRSILRKKYDGFHIIKMKNILMKFWIWDSELGFIFLQVNVYLQMTVFEKMVEFDVFYRDPKKCSTPLRIFLNDWQKIETTRDGRYRRKQLKVQQDNLALFRRKHGVAHEEKNDNEFKNYLNFCLFTHFFQVSHLFVNWVFFSFELSAPKATLSSCF